MCLKLQGLAEIFESLNYHEGVFGKCRKKIVWHSGDIRVTANVVERSHVNSPFVK